MAENRYLDMHQNCLATNLLIERNNHSTIAGSEKNLAIVSKTLLATRTDTFQSHQ